jgi:hypothetical protein
MNAAITISMVTVTVAAVAGLLGEALIARLLMTPIRDGGLPGGNAMNSAYSSRWRSVSSGKRLPEALAGKDQPQTTSAPPNCGNQQ